MAKTLRTEPIGGQGGGRKAHVFAEGLELVLGEVLALLHLRDPQIQIHREGLAGAGGGWRRARGWGGEAKGILGRGFEKGRGLG